MSASLHFAKISLHFPKMQGRRAGRLQLREARPAQVGNGCLRRSNGPRAKAPGSKKPTLKGLPGCCARSASGHKEGLKESSVSVSAAAPRLNFSCHIHVVHCDGHGWILGKALRNGGPNVRGEKRSTGIAGERFWASFPMMRR